MKIENYKAKILEEGWKLTKQRLQLLTIILENSLNYFSAEDLYEITKQVDVQIASSTIYRNLELFEDLQILRSVLVKSNGIKYFRLLDLENADLCHQHLICVNCNQFIKIANEIHSYNPFSKNKYNFQISEQDLIFYGTCEACLCNKRISS